MPTVSQNQLTGNYGSSLVAKRLSSECLIRPVAADTDVGIDLYCESLVEGEPFLHFWVQVKAGASQIEENAERTEAKCRLKTKHLAYWFRQPVPVYVAMVPTSGPVLPEPNVYIADISSWTVMNGLPDEATTLIVSDLAWSPEDQDAVKRFISQTVPLTDARLLCRQGVVAPTKTLRSQYTRAVPIVPAARYQQEIVTQLRQTAAMAIYSMWKLNQLDHNTDATRCRLTRVLMQFADDGHWENYMALALSAHAECAWDKAEEYYLKALQAVGGDPEFAPEPGIGGIVQEIQEQLTRARSQYRLSE